MYAQEIQGIATSSFTCSANGTCSGVGYAVQTLFMDLQKQVNRLGVAYGITRLDPVDGKLGPATLRAVTQLALNLSQKLGSNLDSALEDLLIETSGPTTSRDVALNADGIVAALKRDGVAAKPWSVLTAVKDFAAQIVATGGAAADAQIPPDTSMVFNPNQNTVPVATAAQAAATWATATAAQAQQAAYTALPKPGTIPWPVILGVGAVAVVGGVAAALFGKAKS